jgi:hypothetical protein
VAEQLMPIFLDRHDLKGLTAADIADAHRKDLEVQDRYGASRRFDEQALLAQTALWLSFFIQVGC